MHWFAFIGVSLVVLLVRAPLAFPVALDVDESIYLYMAEQTLIDGLPYIGAFDHKGPLLYWAFAPFVYFFEGEIVPVRWAGNLLLLGAMFFTYLSALTLSGRKFASLWAPFLLGMAFFHPKVVSTCSELFFVLPTAASFYLFVSGKNDRKLFFAQGALFAVIAFVKLNGIISLAWIPIWYFLDGIRKKQWTAAIQFTLGAGAITFLVALPFLISGKLDVLIYNYWTYNQQYASNPHWLYNTTSTWMRLMRQNPAVLVGTLGLLWLLIRPSQKEQHWWALLLFVIFSLGSAMAPGHPYEHYYVPIALPLSLTIAYALRNVPQKTAIGASLAVIFIFILKFRAGPTALYEQRNTWDHTALTQISQYIHDNSKKEDTVFLWGTPPVIHYLSRRRCPVRHFYYAFFGPDEPDRRHVEGSFAQMINQPPKFLVFYSHPYDNVLPRAFLDKFKTVKIFGQYEVRTRID